MIADSLSGVSGAGKKVEADYLFVECNESVRPYGIPKHRHLSEIEQELSLASGQPVVIQFSPHLIPVNRGILTTLYFAPHKHFATTGEMNALGEQIISCYGSAYGSARRQGVAGHKKCFRDEHDRDRVAAGPADGPADCHERIG